MADATPSAPPVILVPSRVVRDVLALVTACAGPGADVVRSDLTEIIEHLGVEGVVEGLMAACRLLGNMANPEALRLVALAAAGDRPTVAL